MKDTKCQHMLLSFCTYVHTGTSHLCTEIIPVSVPVLAHAPKCFELEIRAGIEQRGLHFCGLGGGALSAVLNAKFTIALSRQL